MKPLRPAGDLSALPTVTFGSRSLMWWGTLGWMTIEGWTTALLVGSYLYLRQNYTAWPPLRTPYPSLLVPSINLAIMLVSLYPAWKVDRAGKRLDERGVKRWLLIASAVSAPTIVLRWWELWALNTRWDTNAYGSAAWTIVGFHTTLLALDVCDTIGLTMFFHMKKQPMKSYSDASDNTFYWYFTVGIWIPIYLIIYVGPRIF
jgi:cytochrome c oxidase subunit 3